MKKLILAALAWLILIFPIAAAIGCTATPELPPVEVREYQGQKLSSIDDFRENSIRGPQHIDISTYRLKITGLVANPKEYTYEEVINKNQRYKKVVTLDCVEGWGVTILWEGVLFKDLIKEAQAGAAKVVIFRAYDGYSTSLPLDYLLSQDIIIAYKMNEAVIPPERGFPLMLVAESKWGYKWIKWLTEIELSNDSGFRGFWEERGYSNSADRDKEFFE